MKFLQALVIIVASLLFTNCKKATLVKPDTSLEITIRDNATSSIVPGATVWLFSNIDDLYNQENAVNTGTTDGSGIVKFTGLKAIRYYFSAEAGCKSNAFLPNSTTLPITSDVTNVVLAQVQSIGTLSLKNSSSNPYKVYINGVLAIESQTGNTTETVYYPAQAVTIRVLQISGYAVYPTDKTYTGNLTCGGQLNTDFPF